MNTKNLFVFLSLMQNKYADTKIEQVYGRIGFEL